MSTNGGNRKSMDDVLSSIRRIIGNEGEEAGGPPRDPGPGAADAGPPRGGTQPLDLGAPIAPPRPTGATGGEGPGDPLSLTPNMRVDFSKLKDDDPDADAPVSPPEPAMSSGPKLTAVEPSRPVPPMPESLAAEATGTLPPAPPPSPADLSAHPPADGETETAFADEDEDALIIDEAALEDLIRRIVREEIDQVTAGPTDADMRRIVQEELMGDVGQNISRNVQALIKAEVAKLKAG